MMRRLARLCILGRRRSFVLLRLALHLLVGFALHLLLVLRLLLWFALHRVLVLLLLILRRRRLVRAAVLVRVVVLLRVLFVGGRHRREVLRLVRIVEGLVGRGQRRLALIDRGELIAIFAREARLVLLVGRRGAAVFPGLHLGLRRFGANAALTAVIADVRVVVLVAVDDRLIHVGVVNDRFIDVRVRGVIAVLVTGPRSADETGSDVTAAIVHAAVEADAGAPVAAVPAVGATVVTPVAWSPVGSNRWRGDPDAGNPVVTG